MEIINIVVNIETKKSFLKENGYILINNNGNNFIVTDIIDVEHIATGYRLRQKYSALCANIKHNKIPEFVSCTNFAFLEYNVKLRIALDHIPFTFVSLSILKRKYNYNVPYLTLICTRCKKEIVKSVENLLKGKGCDNCCRFITIDKYSLDIFKKWDYDANAEADPCMIIINSMARRCWVCDKDARHKWKASPNSMRKNSNCPYCNPRKVNDSNRLSIKFPELVKEWNYEKSYPFTPETVSYGSHHVVWWDCPNGHLYKSLVKDRTRGNNCPICRESKGETAFENVLKKYEIVYAREYRIPECKNINTLPFDFAMFSKEHVLCALGEFNGEQHYRVIDYSSRNYAKAERVFKNVQIRDAIKLKYCADHNIPLLIIPYWDMEKVDSILTAYLKELKLL
jgi:hypothetical protein